MQFRCTRRSNLVEIGFNPLDAAWALGLVSLLAVPGQVALGHLSDRIGREWVWTVGSVGCAVCYLILLVMRHAPTPLLVYLMVGSQGMLGYGLTAVLGTIPAEIFGGHHYGAIFGALMLSSMLGGAAGPWVTGLLEDTTGSYAPAFSIAAGLCLLSAVAIWLAAPRKVRAVAGRVLQAG
jgi:MFS family permease